MQEFRVLNGDRADEGELWTALWAAWPEHEVMAHPVYVKAFARPGDRPLCIMYQDDNGAIMLPLIQRPLASEPWTLAGEAACDLITPYGYGGPFRSGEPTASRFWAEFTEWASGNRVVSLFARFSLFPDQLAPFDGHVETKAQNVVRWLDLDEHNLWKQYDHKVRKNVNKAVRSGLTVEVDETGSRLDDFLDIYYLTMDRRHASAGYYFPRDFFETIVNGLREQFAFFHVLSGDKVVSTELVLVSTSHIYSFLGGTLPEAFEHRPNDLLKHQVILWGAQHGKKAFVLGGGYSDQDGIFQYKKAFAPDGIMPFRVGTRVFDEHEYERLNHLRSASEGASGNHWLPAAGYFPTYRG